MILRTQTNPPVTSQTMKGLKFLMRSLKLKLMPLNLKMILQTQTNPPVTSQTMKSLKLKGLKFLMRSLKLKLTPLKLKMILQTQTNPPVTSLKKTNQMFTTSLMPQKIHWRKVTQILIAASTVQGDHLAIKEGAEEITEEETIEEKEIKETPLEEILQGVVAVTNVEKKDILLENVLVTRSLPILNASNVENWGISLGNVRKEVQINVLDVE